MSTGDHKKPAPASKGWLFFFSARRGGGWGGGGRPPRRRPPPPGGGRAPPTTTGLFLGHGLTLGRGAQRGRQTVGIEARGLSRLGGFDRALATRTTATARRGFGLCNRRGLFDEFGRGVGIRLFGRDRLFAPDGTAIVVATAIVAAGTIVAVAARTFVTRLTLAAALGVALLLAGANGVALVAIILALILEAVVILIVARFLARATLILLLEARAALAQHPEIVIGELPIIFGVDPVALTLRLGRQILVLFVQLVGVAARAVVDAIAIVGAARISPRTLPIIAATTTATAAGLPIIDQAVRP
jgi:hypothetical protein